MAVNRAGIAPQAIRNSCMRLACPSFKPDELDAAAEVKDDAASFIMARPQAPIH